MGPPTAHWGDPLGRRASRTRRVRCSLGYLAGGSSYILRYQDPSVSGVDESISPLWESLEVELSIEVDPRGEWVRVSDGSGSQLGYDVYDLLGRRVSSTIGLRQSGEATVVDISALTSGGYIVVDSRGISSKAFVVVR